VDRMISRRRASCVVAACLALTSLGRAFPAYAADVVVRPLQTKQTIDGFGASSAWTASDMSDSDADLAFSTDGGAGLSLLRVRIAPDGSCGEVATAQKAIARGAKVWAAPWSPPPEWKSGVDDAGNGGSLIPTFYDSWANRLAMSVQTLQAEGVNLIGLSAQNEPTTAAVNRGNDYESCVYTQSELVDFVGQHLAPALDDAGLRSGSPSDAGSSDAGSSVPATASLKIIAPETQDWGAFATFESAFVADDGGAFNELGTLASHSYGNVSPSPYPAITASGKSLWQTEVYDQTSSQSDPGIVSGLWVARAIHQALVTASVNAWHYWWLEPLGVGRGGLWDFMTGQPSKRLYTMGNFSRFVRPGFVRVHATELPQPCGQVQVSAYYDQPSGTLVVVAINSDTVAYTQGFLFDSVTAGSWQSWVTSDSQSLGPGVVDASLDGGAAGGRVVTTLPAQSVTTLQGFVTAPGPTLSPDAGSDPADTVACGDAAPPVTGGSGCGLACSIAARRTSRGGPLTGWSAAGCMALTLVARRRAARRRSNYRGR
jgi:glucuronoarabinoxylan endo-1,4-beta-xylanase